MAELRAVEPVDVEELRSLLDGIFRRPRGVFDQTQISDFPLVFRESNFANCQVIVKDGRIVSHAAVWPREIEDRGRILKAGILVAVATLPDYRRRGYAAQLVQSLMQKMRKERYDFCVLWTAVPDFYSQLGWEAVVPSGRLLQVSAEDLTGLADDEFSIVPFDSEQHLDALCQMLDQDALRMKRNAEEASALLTLPKVPVHVALRGGRVDAWLAHGRAVNKQGLIDYGGSLDGILSLARKVLHGSQDVDSAHWMAFGGRPDLVGWAESHRIQSERLQSSKGGGVEMVYVVNPSSFDADLREKWFVWGLDWA